MHEQYLFSISQAAKVLGCASCTLRYHLSRGHIPKPSILAGREHYFTAQQLEGIRAYIAKSPAKQRASRGLYSLEEAATTLGVSHGTLDRARKNGSIPAPSHKAGLRSYYTDDDLAVMKTTLEAAKAHQPERTNYFQKEGYCNLSQAGRRLGVNMIVLSYAIKQSKIKGPSHDLGNKQCLYWTDAEVDAVGNALAAKNPYLFSKAKIAKLKRLLKKMMVLLEELA